MGMASSFTSAASVLLSDCFGACTMLASIICPPRAM